MSEILFDYKQFITNTSNSCFEELKECTSNVLPFFEIDLKDVTKEEYIEKVYDYFETMKAILNMKYRYFLPNCLDKLYFLMNSKVSRKTRASNYVYRANEIRTNCKNDKEGFSNEDLKDFARIYVCIMNESLKQERVEDFDFSLDNIDYKAIREIYTGQTNKFLMFEAKPRHSRYDEKQVYALILDIIFFSMKSDLQVGE